MSTKRGNKPKVHTAKDIYVAYAAKLLRDNPTWWGKYDKKMRNYYVFKEIDGKPFMVTSYPRYRNIVETWFLKAQSYIIAGDVLVMGNNLGRIGGRRVDRNFKNKVVDWSKTNAMWEAKGERKGLVYNLGEDWCRIGWNKPGKIKNEARYRFTPTEGNSVSDVGFKQAFSDANVANPLLKYKYQYFPYIMEG